MYAQAFGLEAEPFAPTPDPAFLYLTAQHRDALAAIEYGLRERRGFVTLVGEVGTGKTTVLYSLLETLGATIKCAYLTHTTLSYDELLRAALVDLGEAEPGHSKGELVATLNRFLHDQADDGRITALVVDEAQNLSLQTLEELRLLTDYETFQHKLLQIVLVGQPELDHRLAEPQMRQLRDRIAVRARLVPLPASEVRSYIDHRLRVAGAAADSIFSRSAITAIARWSEGNPRRINTLCHNALLAAYARGERKVDRALVQTAIAELQPGGVQPSRRRDTVRAVLSQRSASTNGAPYQWKRFVVRMAVAVLAALLVVAVFHLSKNDPAALEPTESSELATSARQAASLSGDSAAGVWDGVMRVLDAIIPKNAYLESQRRARGYRE